MITRASLGRVLTTMITLSVVYPLSAQHAVVSYAYGAFGTPGDVAYVVENGRIYQACGAFGSRGPCLFVIEQDRVYHAADAYGRKGICAYTMEGNKFMRAQGSNCAHGSCALLLENDKVFRGEGPFCTKQEGAFVIERGDGPTPTVIYLAEGAFAAKSDALLEVKGGSLDAIVLLTILASY